MNGDDAQTWRPGAVIRGRYEVQDVISTGGMGLVYQVLHRGWNVRLAVKEPRAELLATENGTRDFEAEAAAWVALGEHPHTVSCIYVRRLDGVPRVFAEWMDGGSLAEAVQAGRLYEGGRRTTLRRILDICVQTLWGLQHAHGNGIVHQDVKPANVMLDRDGTVKVTDFGLARARAAAGESTTAPPGTTVLAGYGGMTPAYCSPEQADAAAWTEDSGRPRPLLTRATDTWSWALTVLEMFTGYPPSPYGQAGAEVLAAFLGQPDADRDERIPAVPGPLADLLRRCLAPDPAERPRDMGALADELTALYAGVLGETYPRPQPRPAARLADELSNQALSLHDLGRVDEAEALWQRASDIDPRNPHVVYNRGLHLWRTGRMTDVQLLGDLGQLEQNPANGRLLGLVHLERGDVAAARTALHEAARGAPDDTELAGALELAERTHLPAEPAELSGHTAKVGSVAIADDSRTAVSAATDDGIRVWSLTERRCLRAVQVTGNLDMSRLGITADAGRAAIHCHEGPTHLWDLRAGRLLRVLADQDPHREPFYVGETAVSGDGSLVLATHDAGHIQAWDAGTGEPEYQLRDGPFGQGYFGSLAMSRDGGVAIASGRGADGALGDWRALGPGRGIHVWEPRSGRVHYAIDGEFHRVLLSADGRTAVTELDTPKSLTRMRVWDVAGGRERHGIDRHAVEHQTCKAVSGDGRYAMCGGYYTSELWQLDPPRCLRWWRRGTNAAAFSPDGRFLLTGDPHGALTLTELAPVRPTAPWSFAFPRPARTRRSEGDVVDAVLAESLRLMTDGRYGAAAREVGRARALPGYRRHHALLDRWRELAGAGTRGALSEAWLRAELPVPGMHPTRLTADGRTLLRTAEGIIAWNLGDGALRYELPGYTSELVLSDDSRVAMSGGKDGIRVWEPETGRERHVLAAGSHCPAISSDGRTGISTAKKNGTTLLVWDLTTGEQLRKLKGHRDYVKDVLLSGDGRYAVSHAGPGYTGPRERDRGPLIWDVQKGKCHRPRCEDWGHNTFGLSKAGNVMLSNHDDYSVRVWDVDTGRCRHVLHGHEDLVYHAIASPDGHTGLSASRDGTVRIWDLRAGRCLHVCDSRMTATWPEPVISADARFAVTGHAAKDARGATSVRVWDLATGACLSTLDGPSEGLTWLGLTGDGHRVVGVEKESRAYIWELDWEYDFAPEPP